jgi:hypothetical protein
LAAKSARGSRILTVLSVFSGLTLTKAPCILRQPQANFATAKFGINVIVVDLKLVTGVLISNPLNIRILAASPMAKPPILIKE